MSAIAEYLDSLRGKSIAVIGMGVSNTPLIRMLLRANLKVTICDKSPRERVEEQAAELESLGAKLQLGSDYLAKIHKFDVIFRTPGLSPNTPELVEAVKRGSCLTSEMELFFRLWNALNSLPETQGRRVDAHLILGKSYRQIAREEGVDKSAVRHSVKSGKATMRKYLKKFL